MFRGHVHATWHNMQRCVQIIYTVMKNVQKIMTLVLFLSLVLSVVVPGLVSMLILGGVSFIVVFVSFLDIMLERKAKKAKPAVKGQDDVS